MHHVSLEIHRSQKAEDPFAFRSGCQEYTHRTERSGARTASLEWDEGLLRDLAAISRPRCDPAVVQRLGDRMGRFLADADWLQYATGEIKSAVDRGEPLCITLRLTAAELYALPWELLTLRASGQPLGALPGVTLRYAWPETQTTDAQPRPRLEGGRILLAWSAASGAVPASDHVAAIAAASAAGQHPFDYNRDVLSHVSLLRLSERLEDGVTRGEPISVLHILCHGVAAGSTYGLAWDDQEESAVIDGGRLSRLLTPYAKHLRLVVLCACDSSNSGQLGNHLGSVAQALHRAGIQSVVASRFPLSVDGSVQLTKTLYGILLSEPASLEVALKQARNKLMLLPGLDWAAVQLYARPEDGADTRPIVFRPFRGLLAFQPEHRRFFFGRSSEIRETISDLHALIERKKERLIIVAGGSGTGKSSLVLAGVVPLLREADSQLVFLRMRPGSDPQRALQEALEKRPAGARALLVVDQFEEVFTQTEAPAARTAFARRLFALASEPEPGLRVLVTLRIDFIARCGELLLNDAGLRLDRVAYQEEYRVFVAQMQPEQLRAAIVEPVGRVGLELEAGLVDRILLDVGNEPGALPLLEDVLDLLWQHREGRIMSQAAYTQLGGVIGALQKRADALVGSLPPADLSIAQHLLVNLVAVADDTAQDTRLRVSVDDLRRSCGPVDAASVDRVLKSLVAARLLVQDEEQQTAKVEVAHEALIRKWPKLRSWLDEDREGLLKQRRIKQAAQQWLLQGGDESLLYRGTQLVQASEWRKGWEARMGDQERRFLDASEGLRVREEQAEAERLRRERETEAEHLAASRAKSTLNVLAWIFIGFGILALPGIWFLSASFATDQVMHFWADRGQELLFENGKSSEALLWLHRAREKSTEDRDVPYLLKTAMQSVDATKAVLIGHANIVLGAAFSPDGHRIVTASQDKTARLWNSEDGRLLIELTGHGASVRSATFSPDGRRIVTASEDHTARVWDAQDGRLLVELKGHGAGVHGATFSPDGHRIITVSADHTARVWNTEDGRLLAELKGHEASVTSATFSPDGRRIVTASDDHTARAWDAQGGRLLVELKGHGASVGSATFSPDGRRIVTASDDKTARLWDAEDGRQLVELKGHRSSVRSAAFSPDGHRIVTASEDQTARVWDAEDGRLFTELKGHGSSVHRATYSPDGRRIVTASDDKTARVWDTEDGQLLIELKGHGSSITSAMFRQDGERIVTASEDNTARVWDPQDGRFLFKLKGHQASVRSAGFNPDSSRIVTASDDNTARVWNAQDGRLLVELKGHEASVRSATFSPDGRRIVTASEDETARLWDAQDGRLLAEFKGHRAAVHCAMFSREGDRIVTASEDKTARVWNAQNGRLLVEFKGHEAGVNSATFTHWGNPERIVTASKDKTVRVWDAQDGRLLHELKGHRSSVNSAIFSHDGHRIVSASEDQTARVWNADDGRLWYELKSQGSSVRSATFSPDEDRIVIATEDRTARVWDSSLTGLLAELKGHEASINSAVFSPDGGRIVTASEDKTARVWDWSPEERTTEQMEKLIHCHVPAQFQRVGRDIIIFRNPTPQECQGMIPAKPSPARPAQSPP